MGGIRERGSNPPPPTRHKPIFPQPSPLEGGRGVPNAQLQYAAARSALHPSAHRRTCFSTHSVRLLVPVLVCMAPNSPAGSQPPRPTDLRHNRAPPAHSPAGKEVAAYLQAHPTSAVALRLLTALTHCDDALERADSDPRAAAASLAHAYLFDEKAVDLLDLRSKRRLGGLERAARQRLRDAPQDIAGLLVLCRLPSAGPARLWLYNRCLAALDDPRNAPWAVWAARLYEMRGLCQGAMGRWPAALQDYRAALARGAGARAAPYCVGLCLRALGHTAEGIAALGRYVAEAEPDDFLLPDALYLLALMRLQGRLGAADVLRGCVPHHLRADLLQGLCADVCKAKDAERHRCPFFPPVHCAAKRSVERIVASVALTGASPMPAPGERRGGWGSPGVNPGQAFA